VGLTQDLTVGVGGVYDSYFNGLGEIFYQPSGSPFRAVVSGLIGNNIDVNAGGVTTRPKPRERKDLTHLC
jgi:hypothetical protein